MKKKLFSSLLGTVVAIILFGTIIKLSQNNNWGDNTTGTSDNTPWEMEERLQQNNGANMSEWRLHSTWMNNPMRDLPEILWMSQEEIENALGAGKTMKKLIEENWVEMGQRMWPKNDINWTWDKNIIEDGIDWREQTINSEIMSWEIDTSITGEIEM